MPTYDAYMAKRGAVNEATGGTIYPVGSISSGTALVDEIELWRAPLARPLYPTVVLKSTASAVGTITATFQTGTAVAFTGTTVEHPIGTLSVVNSKAQGPGVAGGWGLYGRFKLVVTSHAGGTANMGTPECYLSPYPETIYQGRTD